MKFGGHTIGIQFSGRIATLRNRVARARYFRGHGVHSPFVYTLVRQVFMCRWLLPGSRELYQHLVALGAQPRRAIELQNLAIHCDYHSFCLDSANAELCVVTPNLPRTEVFQVAHKAAERGYTVVIMSPYDGRERQALCRQLVAEHCSTTIDNRGYLLLFNNNLPKQHFKI
ncbi:MAG: hypothetical protein RR270_02175 [Alistipes sp.]